MSHVRYFLLLLCEKVYKKDKVPEVRRPYECWHCNACVLDCRAHAIELRLPLTHMLLYVDSDTLKPKDLPVR